ncbi:hypothetical protein DM860_011461 [Cuscuta australis]|uniref:ENTH domain-containing protein n=1 Tax=Cuscuta australis TaxID=267555 RepID=A0A328DR52_9ASTE|nr:hypothetical protein DM860_011461 [Cuscuta australis]
MGKLWDRAVGALKDQNSALVATLSRRTALRNPEVEAAVIRATSHNAAAFDYASVEKVYGWIRASPNVFKPLVWSISRRMEKTRNWVVALKGLMLMHGVFCSKIPAVRRIGRLPFDLSNFRDARSHSGKMWAHNDFIRAYFAFLDHKSALLFLHPKEQTFTLTPIMQALETLQKMQDLLDKTLKIKPHSHATVVPLFIEAMDCVVVEIFDLHIRIRSGITKILPKIRSAGKAEAEVALKVTSRLRTQTQELNDHFELCYELGVTNASKPPAENAITKDQIQELEDIVNSDCSPDKMVVKEEMSFVPVTKEGHGVRIVMDHWETFDEGDYFAGECYHFHSHPSLALSNNILQLEQCKEHLPDLITFD